MRLAPDYNTFTVEGHTPHMPTQSRGLGTRPFFVPVLCGHTLRAPQFSILCVNPIGFLLDAGLSDLLHFAGSFRLSQTAIDNTGE